MASAVSPYSSGGGGFTFERAVAARYMAMMLTGRVAGELGDGRQITRVSFQQAPAHSADDIVIEARGADDDKLTLAVAVRRAPNVVQSDGDAQKLIAALLAELERGEVVEGEHAIALVVSGEQTHAVQVAELADIAAGQSSATEFHALVNEPSKYTRALRDRLQHVTALVKHGMASSASDADVADRTWTLLSRLRVLSPRLEGGNTQDWDDVPNWLQPIARKQDPSAAAALGTALIALAAEYGPRAARPTSAMLSRRLHAHLELAVGRDRQGWSVLAHLQDQSIVSVRHEIGSGENVVTLPREAERRAIEAGMADHEAVVIYGESGVGKSALAIEAVEERTNSSAGDCEAVVINLRQLPEQSVDLLSALGRPLEELLGQVAAPQRILVIDGADAAGERRSEVFTYLVRSAQRAGVRVVAVTSAESRQVVADTMGSLLVEPLELPVGGLSDDDLVRLTTAFPKLSRLQQNVRARELMRRPVVVDLLVRSDADDVPLSDCDAMDQVWAQMVRRAGEPGRGRPDEREEAMLLLAQHELNAQDKLELKGRLNAAAVDGLKLEGLLRAPEHSWEVIPQFAHDEVRRYAVARFLLVNGDHVSDLLAQGAPRWSLAAAKLAAQALLQAPGDSAGRLLAMQDAFQTIVDAEHGARWGDVPSEALLGLGDPGPLLVDAWPQLLEDKAAGLARLIRVAKQRHRAEVLLDPIAAEPIIATLLQEELPWQVSKEAADLLTEWLRALVLRDTPAGHPLRQLLRERVVVACAEAELQQERELEWNAAAYAARTPEEIEADERRHAQHAMFEGITMRRHRRDRPEIPRMLTDDTVLEILALLGPDLEPAGEEILRKVIEARPWDLAPTVEELLAGRALCQYSTALLVDLAEAYYIDEDPISGGWREDGIRDHTGRMPPPLASWHYGPFYNLFMVDPRRGIKLLNRMLNHAALARAKILAGLDGSYGHVPDDAVERYTTEMNITGAPRDYVGDGHVWMWYRGTGVGPYPCMSALQALERILDQYIEIEIPIDHLVGLLLDGCESLAMVGMVVGMLVRHIDKAGPLLDPFLEELAVWHLEFSRRSGELSGMAPSSEGIAGAERRTWTFREVAMALTINADEQRAAELKAIEERLVAKAKEFDEEEDEEAEDSERVPFSVQVQNWASALDRSRYHTRSDGNLTYIEHEPLEDVRTALQPGNEDLARGQQVMGLVMKYVHKRNELRDQPLAELVDDLTLALQLHDDPPKRTAVEVDDALAATSAAALRSSLIDGQAVPPVLLGRAAAFVVTIGERGPRQNQWDIEETYFEQAADRSAASALPLLLLPAADNLRNEAAITVDQVVAACETLAVSTELEARLHLARGLDALWNSPCSTDACHHEKAMRIAEKMATGCVFGDWDGQRRTTIPLGDPLGSWLETIDDDLIYVGRLDAVTRAMGAAAAADHCAAGQATDLLRVLLDAHRRGQLAHDEDYDHRGSHAHVAARAMLTTAGRLGINPIIETIEGYRERASLLNSFLTGLIAVAEENPAMARTARDLWPTVIETIVRMRQEQATAFGDGYFGDVALARALPRRIGDHEFLYREVTDLQADWPDPDAWHAQISAWVEVAGGRAESVDALITLLRTLNELEQVRIGLPWVGDLVLIRPEGVARRSWSIDEWLIQVRPHAEELGQLDLWQRVVDALVVAGSTALAVYSE